MQIERKPANRQTLEAFADQRSLTMAIMERTRTDLARCFDYSKMRYYASFKGVDVVEGQMLSSCTGNGGTEDEALSAYARQISGKCLVIGAFTPERREIWAPEITYGPPQTDNSNGS